MNWLSLLVLNYGCLSAGRLQERVSTDHKNGNQDRREQAPRGHAFRAIGISSSHRRTPLLGSGAGQRLVQ
jgi:hypothetical protein